tara:strand:+ start:70 stop:729 length:660 start_codon:yes stop_codon:yes gene_type:complete
MIKLVDILSELNKSQFEYIAQKVDKKYTDKDFNSSMNILSNTDMKWDKIKKFLSVKKNQNWDSLKKMISDLDIKRKSKLKWKTSGELLPGAKKIYQDDRFLVYWIKNKKGACELGKGTKWCISAKNNNQWDYHQEPEGDETQPHSTFYFVFDKVHPLDKFKKLAVEVSPKEWWSDSSNPSKFEIRVWNKTNQDELFKSFVASQRDKSYNKLKKLFKRRK